MKRTGILRTAELTITGEKEEDYGVPEENFKKVAYLWNTAFGIHLTPEDIPIAMILLKVARQTTGAGNIDTWVDIAGYAALGGEVAS